MIYFYAQGRRFFVVGTVAFALLPLLCATLYSDTPATAPATAPVVLDFAPISYFQDNCARCHGSYGRTYTPGMAGRYTDAALHDKVEMMANGPAQAPLEPAQLDEVAAYQLSLNRGKPFVVIQSIKAVDGGACEVAGEVTPKAAVVVTSGAGRAIAVMDGHVWTARLSSATDAVHVAARVGEEQVEVTADTPGTHAN